MINLASRKQENVQHVHVCVSTPCSSLCLHSVVHQLLHVLLHLLNLRPVHGLSGPNDGAVQPHLVASGFWQNFENEGLWIGKLQRECCCNEIGFCAKTVAASWNTNREPAMLEQRFQLCIRLGTMIVKWWQGSYCNKEIGSCSLAFIMKSRVHYSIGWTYDPSIDCVIQMMEL
jgi:hypothetical protein